MKPPSSSLRSLGILVIGLICALAGPVPGRAQQVPADQERAAQTPAPDTDARVDPLSPRAALKDYLALCRQGRFDEAAAYLTTVPDGEDAAETARRLKVVLDRHIWFDMSQVSASRGGNLDDGLPEHRERLGEIETPAGSATVEMVRTEGDAPPGWVFAPESIRRVDAWYDALGNRWLRDRLPPWLLRAGPLELQWWQWAALPIALLVAWVAARLTVGLLHPVLVAWSRRSTTTLDDMLVERLMGPARLFLLLLLFRSFVSQIDLVIPAHEFVTRIVRGVFLGGIFWVLIRGVDVAMMSLRQSSLLESRQGLTALMPFLGRSLRTVILALAAVTILQEFGFQVTGLLAGMGLAGMAVALAGQKTVENLIGSGTILADQPFRPGDFVRIGDMVGTVETVGLRSSRIRTLDRTLVTLPNGSLSEMRLETFAARDRIRLLCNIGLTYSTKVEQMKQVIAGLEGVLRDHPRVCEDPRRVRFVEFGASSLNLEVLAYVQTTDWAEFLGLRQEIYLRCMEVVEGHGAEFAFPTQTVHLEGFPGAPAANAAGSMS